MSNGYSCYPSQCPAVQKYNNGRSLRVLRESDTDRYRVWSHLCKKRPKQQEKTAQPAPKYINKQTLGYRLCAVLLWVLVTLPCSLGHTIVATWAFHDTDPQLSFMIVKYCVPITISGWGVGVRHTATVAQRVQTDFEMCVVITTRVPAGNPLSKAFRNSALLWCS